MKEYSIKINLLEFGLIMGFFSRDKFNDFAGDFHFEIMNKFGSLFLEFEKDFELSPLIKSMREELEDWLENRINRTPTRPKIIPRSP